MDPDQAFEGGGSQIGGRARQEGLHLLKYQVCE